MLKITTHCGPDLRGQASPYGSPLRPCYDNRHLAPGTEPPSHKTSTLAKVFRLFTPATMSGFVQTGLGLLLIEPSDLIHHAQLPSLGTPAMKGMEAPFDDSDARAFAATSIVSDLEVERLGGGLTNVDLLSAASSVCPVADYSSTWPWISCEACCTVLHRERAGHGTGINGAAVRREARISLIAWHGMARREVRLGYQLAAIRFYLYLLSPPEDSMLLMIASSANMTAE